MWARLNNNLTIRTVERKTGYNRATILRIETGAQSPSLEYLQAFAHMLYITTAELVEILEDKRLAEHAMQIARAVKNMRKSIKACELQKAYIIDAISYEGYRTVTEFCRENNMTIKTPYNFLANNNGTVCALRDVTLYKYVHMLNMKYDEEERLWKHQ